MALLAPYSFMAALRVNRGGIMFKIVLIVLWSVCAIGMNLGAKKMSMGLTIDAGFAKLIMSGLRSHWTYIFLFCALGSAVFYLWLLRLMPLSIAGSIVSALGIVLIVLTGAIFCGENILQTRQIIGIILTMAGIITLQSGGM
jgi:multidrug transporter EmrE-like cation transporter